MRTVFSSNDQVAHVWAQQTQASGKSKNIFFSGDSIYSYGYHYKAARIHTVKGKSFALVRSDTYSVSTSGHLASIRAAVDGLMPFFCVTDIDNPKAAAKELEARAIASVGAQLRTVKVTSKDEIKWANERIEEAYGKANELRAILNLKPIYPNDKDLDAVETHLKKRLARYKELNTPDMIAKREAKRKAKEATAEADAISLFRRGGAIKPILRRLPYELIRIKNGDYVETSKGARVPLEQARTLLRMIERGEEIRGQEVGHFRAVCLARTAEDTVVRIGCHRILLSEAKRVLAPLGLVAHA